MSKGVTMSNGVTMSDGGKGSAPRKTRDDEAYSKGWDAIFGRKQDEKQRCEQTDRPDDRKQEEKQDGVDS